MTIDFFKIPKSQIIGAIRRIFSMSTLYKHVKNKALSDEVGVRGGKMCICNVCGKSSPWSKCSVDHRETVVPLDSSAEEMSFDLIISRMWCSQDNLQVLCEECHDLKTLAENNIRKEFKRKKKEDERNKNII